MKRFSKLKMLLWALPTTALVLASTVIFSVKEKGKSDIKWFENYHNNKFQVRNFRIKTSSSDPTIINSLKNFELKIILKHEFDKNSENDLEDLLKNKNQDFIEKIKKSNLIFKDVKTSSLAPFVWFYFENEEQRKNFVEKIQKLDSILGIVLFDQSVVQLSNSNQYDPYYKLYRKINNNNDLFMDFIKQKERENHRSYIPTSKIGILEVGGKFDETMDNDFLNRGYEVLITNKNLELNHHSQEVPLIAAGSQGFDRYAKMYFSSFKTDKEWEGALEWFVKNGVKVINHSYGSIYDLLGSEYNENNLLLDSISRKYGIINVFASGNDNDNRDKGNEWINSKSLSINNIVVGALEYDSYRGISSDNIARYSNYLLFDKYKNLAKPNVVAPGYLYKRKILGYGDSQYNKIGTSYAAPIISGLISTLLREKSLINNDNYRIQAIKAILAVASWIPNNNDIAYKSNGYSLKYGAGIPNFEKMLKAFDNLTIANIDKKTNGTVLATKEFYAYKGQNIRVASSWLFNAGLLKNKENKPSSNFSWYLYLIPFFAIGTGIADLVWSGTHKNDSQLKLHETLKRQEQKLYSDYDLILEYKDKNGNWKQIKKIITEDSTDELIIHNANISGLYRARVVKYKDSLFENSIDDNIAMTYLVFW
ncbi:S8 family serine peptidase [Mycoplasma sp. 4423]